MESVVPFALPAFSTWRYILSCAFFNWRKTKINYFIYIKVWDECPRYFDMLNCPIFLSLSCDPVLLLTEKIWNAIFPVLNLVSLILWPGNAWTWVYCCNKAKLENKLVFFSFLTFFYSFSIFIFAIVTFDICCKVMLKFLILPSNLSRSWRGMLMSRPWQDLPSWHVLLLSLRWRQRTLTQSRHWYLWLTRMGTILGNHG